MQKNPPHGPGHQTAGEHRSPARASGAARLHNALLLGIEHCAALILAIDVGVVFLSVIMRYFLHQPFDWAEEVAGILMVMLIFLGAATVVGRQKHVGIDVFLGLFPARWREALATTHDMPVSA